MAELLPKSRGESLQETQNGQSKLLWSLPNKLNICIKKSSNANSTHLNKKAPTLGSPVPPAGSRHGDSGGRRLEGTIPKCFELC